MIKKNIKKNIKFFFRRDQLPISVSVVLLSVVLTGCLKTRTDVSQQQQNALYAKKNAENQIESQAATAVPGAIVNVNENEELIRSLNGRVEVLENQLAALQEAKLVASTQDSQKIVLLQEALAKMETQIQKLENEVWDSKSDSITTKSGEASDKKTPDTKIKKIGSYEIAEQYFAKGEWKKAIISFQKYTDESPRGKQVADAKFKIGLSFQELGMKEEAMAFYEEVVANYSKTEAGKKSKILLAKLKK